MPGTTPKRKCSHSGGVRAKAGGISLLGGPTCPTKVPAEGTNPCTQSSFATKNVFDVLQELSEPITHNLHKSLIELLERPVILDLHTVRRVGCERHLHLMICALCGEVERVFNMLVDTCSQVSLVKADVLQPECRTTSRRPLRPRVANGQYVVGGTKEAEIALQFVNHREVSRTDLGKKILLKGKFYQAEMDRDMIVGYDFMMETDSGILPAQPSMNLYQNHQLSWLSSAQQNVQCQSIRPEHHQLKVAATETEPAGPTYNEYGVKRKVANRVAADLGASHLALEAFSSGTSAHLRVFEK